MANKKYTLARSVEHNKVLYKAGEQVELSQEEAKALSESGALEDSGEEAQSGPNFGTENQGPYQAPQPNAKGNDLAGFTGKTDGSTSEGASKDAKTTGGSNTPGTEL